MPILVPIALFGWIIVVIAMFSAMKPQRATIAAFILAWLFLPIAGYKFSFFPPYTKITATCLGTVLGIIIFDGTRLIRFRPRLIDFPMLVLCLMPIPAYMSNGEGLGLRAALEFVFDFSIPYFMGRLYFADPEDIKELAVGVFKGGLIYVPLCLFEIKMSPQLHRRVYGFAPNVNFLEIMRYGGFRPTVFMQHGLMVGMWMAMTSVVGFWLWYTRAIRNIWGYSAAYWLLLLIGTTVLCKSTGAIALMCIGIFSLVFMSSMRTRSPLYVLAVIPALYMFTRGMGIWSGQQLLDISTFFSNSDRANSLKARFMQEDLAMVIVRQKPFFGWAEVDVGYDQLWLIFVHSYGIPSIVALTLFFVTPLYLALRSRNIRELSGPQVASALALAMMAQLSMIDNLSNGMINPIFALAVGAATSFFLVPPVRTAPNVIPNLMTVPPLWEQPNVPSTAMPARPTSDSNLPEPTNDSPTP